MSSVIEVVEKQVQVFLVVFLHQFLFSSLLRVVGVRCLYLDVCLLHSRLRLLNFAWLVLLRIYLRLVTILAVLIQILRA